MSVKWIPTKTKGVRFYEHPTRRHGTKLDRYFAIRFQTSGRKVEEGLGWSSEGWTETKAASELAKLREAAKTGAGFVSLAEKRALEAARREAELAEEKQRALDAVSFAEYFTTHYAPHACREKKATSWEREESLFRKWIREAIGDKPLKEIGTVDLERLKQDMANGELSNRSIEYALAVVRQVFNHAKLRGYHQGESPTRFVKKPKVNNARLRYLTHEEADDLLMALKASSQDVHDMALVSLHCGLRFGEIAALAWGRVNLGQRLLTLLDTKHGDRVVPMTKAVADMFTERACDGGLVFTSQVGGEVRSISKTFYRAVESLGLNEGREDPRERVCFHTLRHTFASWHVLAGTDLYTLGKLMGHKTPSMTARYGHLSPEGAIRATMAFEASLSTAKMSLG